VRQGAFESKKSFKQCYTNALKAYKDQKEQNSNGQINGLEKTEGQCGRNHYDVSVVVGIII